MPFSLFADTAGSFQHTAARRRLWAHGKRTFRHFRFQHTAARRRLYPIIGCKRINKVVSTHSRPKAAVRDSWRPVVPFDVSTHSRPKAAVANKVRKCVIGMVSTHSRPKAAVLILLSSAGNMGFQHTAARRRLSRPAKSCKNLPAGFNTQPPEGGCGTSENVISVL
ncbi:Uncharacterised protein [Neisseria weaveri]|uniref:Uncharacterized protein n=1 Tax=Neisseria weaveri TaxID=28091 RepID=A0A3S4YNH2_9NEIS|nr:Uncharacterised protein [Neisseria weaveri]